MNITLNGEPRELPEGSTLAQLVALIAESPQAVATAVNQEFVARDSRDACVLREGDAVFTFQPITGG
ncbi:sulfur carrier protein ThiS [Ramlibacter sp. AW1]|uniref:Sulfur carrier protein ThiS n=1 Tax=Ramlibacter aurantiacus TaxID=2801330 RepID=A0A936ZR79_9BURK|nr:sulfur carrier protein ThiS [Ramlibacter aurantiacus]MBL0421998.1 sulfur carrier protein ThiS [Ramlibacter aurantiacus]